MKNLISKSFHFSIFIKSYLEGRKGNVNLARQEGSQTCLLLNKCTKHSLGHIKVNLCNISKKTQHINPFASNKILNSIFSVVWLFQPSLVWYAQLLMLPNVLLRLADIALPVIRFYHSLLCCPIQWGLFPRKLQITFLVLVYSFNRRVRSPIK